MNNRGLFLALFIIVATAGIMLAVNYDKKSDSGRMVSETSLTARNG